MNAKAARILTLLSEQPSNYSDGQYSFVGSASKQALGLNTAGQSLLGRIQSYLKRHGQIYGFLLRVFGPVDSLREYKNSMSHVLAKHGSSSFVVNYGSGPSPLPGRPDIINVDLFPFGCVDLLVPLGPLPIRSSSVDLVLSIAVLEHVASPPDMIKDIYRILKPGGEAFCFIPFMQPIHAAPGDFQRWTPEGLSQLFKDFTILKIAPASGPASSISWLTASWIASIFSFGSRNLYQLLYLGLIPIFAPIKYIDRLTPWVAGLSGACSGYYVHCFKS